ncbi:MULTISPECIES: tryptophan halogenase family protein [unclassified Arsukibacterium]|uniref:tryptophan halogenase family protein n=1 Tax=unclassified Arsukibacterium TaxID=2635278 RepID=UPI000C986AF0|nr:MULTISPECIES: tryptophan 7-halogenase [unclassified Arsukibacterium]MAA95794.1 tryptophan halogenase [Rheinheimera sp.]HAW92133.1 tryptophan 7-halogenase [Candidatus Azambacteria bacterium]|tara:strand:- start:47211 stop:48845 length:1635 start_codon:yes stop_codon:yes gene_type:complete
MQQRKVVIVGGGSAGWMTAAYLNGALNKQGTEQNVLIELLESPDIPRISVGEATIPSMRHLLAVVGVDEREFMQATDATFKQSIKYCNWVHNDSSFYHHPFSSMRVQPIDRAGRDWLKSDRSIPFMETCSAQPIICEMGLAPLMLGKWDMGSRLNYAYHMNAQKFADYLRDFSTARGVVHTLANLTGVDMQGPDKIVAVTTDQQQRLTADLFVDCTGFKAKLIEEKMNVGFEDCSQWLLCDRAITMHLPYDKFYPGMIRPYTTATALSAGWIWDIPMQNQRSVGYVHASQFISIEQAEQELRAYQGPGTEQLKARVVDFKVGRRQGNWRGNCVAIGLSGGFIEPLESTGLYLSDLGAVLLAEHFPYDDQDMDILAGRYNRLMANRFYEILDFINMHYCMTKRTDTAFWREVQKPERITERLKAKLAFWRIKPPSAHDFQDQWYPGMVTTGADTPSSLSADSRAAIDTGGLWNHESYECILYGMGFLDDECRQRYGPDLPPTSVHPAIIQRLQMARQKLPPHAIWLNRVLGMPEYPTAYQPKGWL